MTGVADLVAELCRLDRGNIPTGTATDHNDIVRIILGGQAAGRGDRDHTRKGSGEGCGRGGTGEGPKHARRLDGVSVSNMSLGRTGLTNDARESIRGMLYAFLRD